MSSLPRMVRTVRNESLCLAASSTEVRCDLLAVVVFHLSVQPSVQLYKLARHEPQRFESIPWKLSPRLLQASPSSRPEVRQVLHGQQVDVEEAVDAVGQTLLLARVQLAVLDVARDALVPANLRQGVCFCPDTSPPLSAAGRRRMGRGRTEAPQRRRLTRLYPRPLLLVGDELRQLRLVLLRQARDVGLRGRGVGLHRVPAVVAVRRKGGLKRGTG